MDRQGTNSDPVTVETVVDNPEYVVGYHNERYIKATRTLREDPLGQMKARNQISEAQHKAGTQWQRDYETAGPRMKSSGHLQEPVDGGGFSAAPNPERIEQWLLPKAMQRQVLARERLEFYRHLLGADGHSLVTLVLADKLSLREVANRRHLVANKATVTYVGHRFREALSRLAVSMGLASDS